MKLLIIEDEKELAQAMDTYLSEQGYFCELAPGFNYAMERIRNISYECILVDLMLPGGDGLVILEELKRMERMDGVIIISARNSLEDKVNALKMGADDYLAKPFHLSELAARIYSLTRRKQFGNANVITQKELVVDVLGRVVQVNGKVVSLTKMEYGLLMYFISNTNKVVSRTALAEMISGEVAGMFCNYDVVYAHIKNLKKKLQEAGYGNYLKTIYGTGYKWQV